MATEKPPGLASLKEWLMGWSRSDLVSQTAWTAVTVSLAATHWVVKPLPSKQAEMRSTKVYSSARGRAHSRARALLVASAGKSTSISVSPVARWVAVLALHNQQPKQPPIPGKPI